jgi:glycosyltransferase involved in cell wall biosynthesis
MMRHRHSRRILIVTPSLPYPPIWGSGIRVYQFIRLLAQRHDVSVLTYQEPGEEHKATAIRQLGATLHVVPQRKRSERAKRTEQFSSLFSAGSFQRRSLFSPQLQMTLDDLAARERYDVVQVESSHLAGFSFSPDAVLVVDDHNVEFELLYRMYRSERSALRRLYNGLEFTKVKREETRAWRGAAGCILTSARDEKIVNQLAPLTPTTVGPNAVDTQHFSPVAAPAEPNALVMTGLMNYRPNLDGALYFLRDIFPRILAVQPRMVCYLVGAGATPELKAAAGRNVVVTDTVPDIRPDVHRAAAVIVPLRIGAGTRLKVLEALAMGKAVISTSIGCEGIDVVHGTHLLVADTPQAFADAVLGVVGNQALARRLGQDGRALTVGRYTWESVVEGVEHFHERLLQARRSNGVAVSGVPAQGRTA